MHEDYDDNDYDHDYDDSQDHIDNKYKHYFKFDPAAWDAWGKMLYDALNDIVAGSPDVWYIDFSKTPTPVNSYLSDTGKGISPFQYLGNNYQGQQIWKKQYFIYDPINIEYRRHIQSHVTHFLQQPNYYKGLFDILN